MSLDTQALNDLIHDEELDPRHAGVMLELLYAIDEMNHDGPDALGTVHGPGSRKTIGVVASWINVDRCTLDIVVDDDGIRCLFELGDVSYESDEISCVYHIFKTYF
jgi:hypothetical protein